MIEPGELRHRVEAVWPERPWLFAALLAGVGLALHFLLDGANDSGPRAAAAAFLAFAAGVFVFTAERGRLLTPAVFALATGAIVGGLTWRAVGAGNDLADGSYALAAAIFACLLAVPLFQADFHRLFFRTSYRDTHYFVWTDAITGAGTLAFLGLAWLLIWLVAALLGLVGIPLEDLLEEAWFAPTYCGLVLGAGLGTLRNQLRIIGTLQSVVLLVLSILALPLAIAIAVFLLAVLVSGPSVLWNATDSATPVLLSIAIAAFVLANAVIRDADEDTEGRAIFRWTGFALALGLLPLALFAAISTGLRVNQYGLSPERLWALASVAVAVAFSLAYFIDALAGVRAGWRDRLRASNLRLAAGTAMFALLLALPILDFAAISTRDQLARLQSGEIAADEFDFAALRWNFGEPGRSALGRLARSADPAIRERAEAAQAMESRYLARPRPGEEPPEIVFQGGSAAERAAVRPYLIGNGIAYPDSVSTVLFAGRLGNPSGQHLILLRGEEAPSHFLLQDDGEVVQLRVDGGRLVRVEQSPRLPSAQEDDPTIEIRPFEGRQLYVEGEPVGDPFK
jgi:hypothetical protein